MGGVVRSVGGGVAQRRVRVTSSPAGRSATASDTGSHGRRNGTRVHAGMSATAAPAIRAYGARAASGSGGCRSR
jgi:hypothetical protein